MSFFFFFNDTATTEIYTLSLHDALPILAQHHAGAELLQQGVIGSHGHGLMPQPARYHLPHQGTKILMWKPLANEGDRKSTRLNSSHSQISYAVFCLKKKKKKKKSLLHQKKKTEETEGRRAHTQ